MKKTCLDCKAMIYGEMCSGRCILGYKIDIINFKPLEKCNKPKTIKELVRQMGLKK